MIDPTFQIVLYEGAGSEPLPAERRFTITSALLDRGYSVLRAAPAPDAGVSESASPPASLDGSTLLVIGDFGGRPPALEDALGSVPVEVRDLGDRDGVAVLDLVESFRGERPMNQPGKWKPWFPVIDYDRCTNCLQCLSFCLFDVYGVDGEHQIEVRNQDNCKTNCPACSRVCPEVAIMFPKYAQSPINGAPVSEGDVQREKMKVDISALLGGDIYSRLRDRSAEAKSRFSKERSPDKALAERKRCLTKLQASGIIPEDVLSEIDIASLPSPEEIQRKAEAARAAAEAARDAAGAARS